MASLSRRWSPYSYTYNNPIRFIDPNGMWVETAKGYSTTDPGEIAAFIAGVKAKAEQKGTMLFDDAVEFVSNGASKGKGLLRGFAGRALGVVGLLLDGHETGRGSTIYNRLSEGDENRYQELLGKQSSLLAVGEFLTPQEQEELNALQDERDLSPFLFPRTGTSNDIKSWIPTEPDAQGDERVNGMIKALKENDPFIWAEPIYVVVIAGRTYLLDGHNRVEAMKRIGYQGPIPYTEVGINDIHRKSPYSGPQDVIDAANK